MTAPEQHFHVHLHGFPDHTEQLNRMEQLMATETEVLNTILGKVNDVFADVRALLASERAQMSDEGQAKADELTSAIDAFDAEIGDADGSDVPPAPVE